MYFTQVFKQQVSDFKHMYQTSPSYLFPAFNFAFLDSQKKKKNIRFPRSALIVPFSEKVQ